MLADASEASGGDLRTKRSASQLNLPCILNFVSVGRVTAQPMRRTAPLERVIEYFRTTAVKNIDCIASDSDHLATVDG